MVLLEIHAVRVVGSVPALGWALCSIRRYWVGLTRSPVGQRCLGALMCFSLSFLELGRLWVLDTQMRTPPSPLGETEVLVQMVFRAGQSEGVFSCVCLLCRAAALSLLVHHSPSHLDLHPHKPFCRVTHQPASLLWLGHPRSQ